jgi:hypothetical protein
MPSAKEKARVRTKLFAGIGNWVNKGWDRTFTHLPNYSITKSITKLLTGLGMKGEPSL